MKNYVEIIRDLREDNDKTQKEIAEYLGILLYIDSGACGKIPFGQS